MTVELDALVVSLRADTRRFARDIAEARSALDRLQTAAAAPQAGFAAVMDAALAGNEGLEAATRQTVSALEGLFTRFARTGKLAFEDLRSVALAALADIARALLDIELPAGGGLPGLILGSASSLLGRASGGPVAPERPYVVGERGPELFVPRTAGQILPGPGAAASRPLSITVNITGPARGEDIRQSGTQVALAVARALKRAERFS